ncbi:hypothetical protein [Methylobacterium persicinum]|uniref:Uncharacterized protein n=1 Tax=Methylobacterium persicinum TaxID=374426 RepID=A0ABU0HSD2_9HYPH|nr:hypothetical protein [Methylobacterium persicinum]MDQ0445221.1 hypothetical protein [Methylobacterium persicinum]GJE37846.1 hypothetical protein KHHGKMAE_1908 [Methylobacterium persicinum]
MPTPNTNAPIADPQTGMVTGEWLQYFQSLPGKPAAEKIVQATGSPFVYTATAAGHLVVQGTLTALSIVRGRTTISISPSVAMIPLSQGDQAVLGYSSAPGLVFLPS